MTRPATMSAAAFRDRYGPGKGTRGPRGVTRSSQHARKIQASIDRPLMPHVDPGASDAPWLLLLAHVGQCRVCRAKGKGGPAEWAFCGVGRALELAINALDTASRAG